MISVAAAHGAADAPALRKIVLLLVVVLAVAAAGRAAKLVAPGTQDVPGAAFHAFVNGAGKALHDLARAVG